MSYTITSESQMIDLNAIKLGCEKLEKNTYKYDLIKGYLEDAKSCLDLYGFSVNNKTLEGKIEEIIDDINNAKKMMESAAEYIREAASNKYEKQLIELTKYKNSVINPSYK